MSDSLFSVFFANNFWNFSSLVHQGELDIFLTKPVHPLFLILTRSIHFTAFLNVTLGLLIALKFSTPAGFLGGIHWLKLIFWLFIGLTTATLICFTFSILVFWLERNLFALRLFHQCYPLASKPDPFYPKIIRHIIRTLLPFALIGSIPARALLFGISWQEYLQIFFTLGGFFIFNIFLWKKGLKRYQSASS